MSNVRPCYFIGLMSGTSLDAIDAALIGFHEPLPTLIRCHQEPLPKVLKNQLLALCTPGANEIERMGECDTQLGELFAKAALTLLQQANLTAGQITAIGSHGQTIRHCPRHNHPFTLQIGDPNRIAQLTGITTVADFRRRDMAAGGEGAPLAPALHCEVFSTDHNRAILNVGGIANLTLLPGDHSVVTGFDTGPGNVLMDTWFRLHHAGEFDENGAWAAAGTPITPLLAQLLAEPYLHLSPPKSTGRELFNYNWLHRHLQISGKHAAQDVAATLAEFTAKSVADALARHFPRCPELFVCGGGAHNGHLLDRLARLLPGTQVTTTEALGMDPDWVEAIAFAWMAKRTLERKPGNIPSITGATRECILGGVYYS